MWTAWQDLPGGAIGHDREASLEITPATRSTSLDSHAPSTVQAFKNVLILRDA